MKTIAQRIREERRRLGLNQTEFGVVGGVIKQSQLNYESGTRCPDSAYLERIAAVGADVFYILTGRRMEGLLLSEEVEVLKPEDRELLENYRRCPTEVRRSVAMMCSMGAGAQSRNSGRGIDELTTKSVDFSRSANVRIGNVHVNSISSGDVQVKSGDVHVGR